jgi:hypothetical protein
MIKETLINVTYTWRCITYFLQTTTPTATTLLDHIITDSSDLNVRVDGVGMER